MTFPLAIETVLNQEQNIFDQSTDGKVAADFKYPWHGFAGTNALIGMMSHGGGVMCKQHTSFLRRPFQDCRIVCSRETRILDTNNAELLPPPQETANDVIVEVFIGSEQ